MNLRAISLLLNFGLTPVGTAFASTPKAEPPPKPYTASTLPSGLEVIAIESHKVPLVTIVLAAKAGGMTETPDIRGLTHLWEHMFFKGNKRIPNQEAFNKRIRQLGIVYNGDTAAEKVRYYFTLPSVFLDEGLQFMADAISTPLLEQSELEKERRVVLDEYDRSAANPGFDFYNLERVLMYGNVENRRDPLGLRPVIENATRDQLYRIKDEVFVPSNSAIVVAGDFNPQKLQALVQKHFGAWQNPANWQSLKAPTFPALERGQSFVMTRANVENAQVSLTYPGPRARFQQADSFEADVLGHLIKHKSGRFYRKFVDSGLTFHAGLSYYTQSQAGELQLFAQTAPKEAEKVAKMLESEISEWIKPGYFTKEQLDDVHRNLSIEHKREINQPSEYAKMIAFWWAVTGLDYYDRYQDNLKKIGLPEVQAFVRKWLLKKPHLTGILLSPENAQKVRLSDSATPLVDTHLTMYRKAESAAESMSAGQVPSETNESNKE